MKLEVGRHLQVGVWVAEGITCVKLSSWRATLRPIGNRILSYIVCEKQYAERVVCPKSLFLRNSRRKVPG